MSNVRTGLNECRAIYSLCARAAAGLRIAVALGAATLMHTQAQTPPAVFADWQVEGLASALNDGYPAVRDRAARELLGAARFAEIPAESALRLLGSESADVRIFALRVLEEGDESRNRGAVRVLLGDVDPRVQQAALQVLGRLGSRADADRISALLESTDVEVRLAAIQALHRLDAQEAAPAVAERLRDREPMVRAAAATALADIGGREYSERIADLLRNRNSIARDAAAVAVRQLGAGEQAMQISNLLNAEAPSIRFAAIKMLEALGASEMNPRIAGRMKDRYENVRAAAIDALGELGGQSFVDDIHAALKDPVVEVRLAALRALGNLNALQYTEAIEEATRDTSPLVRRGAAQALIAVRAHGTGATLAALLDDPDAEVRLAAVAAIGELQTTNVTGALAESVDDASPSVRMAAIASLVNLNARGEADAIAARLKDESEMVRTTAIDALGKLESTRYAPAIVERLSDPSAAVRSAAVSALEAMRAGSQGPAIVRLIGSSDSGARDAAVKTLGAIGALEQAARVADWLRSPEPGVRDSAVQALEAVGGVTQEARIANWLDDRDWHAREASARALAAIGAKSRIAEIAPLLDDDLPAVKAAAAEALGRLDAADHAMKLAKLLDERDPTVRQSAARALGQIGDRAHIGALAARLTDPDSGVREAAFEALRATGPLSWEQVLPVLEAAYFAETNPELVARIRWLAFYLGGRSDETAAALGRLALPDPAHSRPPVDRDMGRLMGKLLNGARLNSQALPKLRADMAEQFADIAERVSWSLGDIAMLQEQAAYLDSIDPQAGERVRTVIGGILPSFLVGLLGRLVILHLAVWGWVIFRYPRSPGIRGFFIWNGMMRRFGGMGYVSWLLIHVAWLRRRMFEPYRALLLSDMRNQPFDPENYYRNLHVLDEESGEIMPLESAIPEIRGHTILAGAAGAGKTQFACDLVWRSPRPATFLPAQKCRQGIVEAIQQKLLRRAPDREFLTRLVEEGGVDICIDGWERLSEDDRRALSRSIDQRLRGGALITTRPLESGLPTGSVYALQPLRREQMEEFLEGREETVARDSPVRGPAFKLAARTFLSDALQADVGPEALEQRWKALGNPARLTLSAQSIADGEMPDINELLQQDTADAELRTELGLVSRLGV